MKVSFSELPGFLNDPEGWAERVARASGGARMSYAHVTRMAAYRFHQTQDPAIARATLTRYFDSYQLSNSDRRAAAEEQLNSYINWVNASAPIVIAHQSRIVVELASGLFSSGQIHRVDLDLVSGGYRAVMLGVDMSQSDDPRTAVLQEGYAMASGRSPDLIVATRQNLDGSGFTAIALSADRRQSIISDLKHAATIAAATLGRLRR